MKGCEEGVGAGAGHASNSLLSLVANLHECVLIQTYVSLCVALQSVYGGQGFSFTKTRLQVGWGRSCHRIKLSVNYFTAL